MSKRDEGGIIGHDCRMIGEEGEASKVAATIANVLKIKRNSLCFCGSGEKWKNCCGSNPGHNPIFIETALDIARAYKQSQGQISRLPAGIWKRFEKASLRRFSCLYPGCKKKPVRCHLVPESILRSYYGGHCKEYRMEDISGLSFVSRGVGEAGCLPVFCSQHDNLLFRKIDQMEVQENLDEQYFLFALKATAFALRKTQYLLGIDSQVEIVRPFLIQAPKGSHITIDISHLETQYIRFVTCAYFYREAIEAYISKNWKYYLTSHRVIRSSLPIFFAALTNPSHDLTLQPINDTTEAIVMSCSAFMKQEGLHVLVSCPGGASQRLYLNLLRQLDHVDDEAFATVVNNLLTVSVETLLMPQSFALTESDAVKIGSANQLATAALKGQATYDLQDTNTPITFI